MKSNNNNNNKSKVQRKISRNTALSLTLIVAGRLVLLHEDGIRALGLQWPWNRFERDRQPRHPSKQGTSSISPSPINIFLYGHSSSAVYTEPVSFFFLLCRFCLSFFSSKTRSSTSSKARWTRATRNSAATSSSTGTESRTLLSPSRISTPFSRLFERTYTYTSLLCCAKMLKIFSSD